jgi:phage terminase small subunit
MKRLRRPCSKGWALAGRMDNPIQPPATPVIPSAAKVNASRLLKSANHIIERVQELQAQAARHRRVTVETIVDELEGARQLAQENSQASAMVAASTAKAKILGLQINHTEVGKPGDFDAITTKEELAKKCLLEANPDAIITATKRNLVISELERHVAAITDIAANNNGPQQEIETLTFANRKTT